MISVAVAMAVIYFLPLISRGEYDAVYSASRSGVSHTQAQADIIIVSQRVFKVQAKTQAHTCTYDCMMVWSSNMNRLCIEFFKSKFHVSDNPFQVHVVLNFSSLNRCLPQSTEVW